MQAFATRNWRCSWVIVPVARVGVRQFAKEVDHAWNNIDENHDVHDEIEQNGKIENDTKAGDDEREGHLFLVRLAEVQAGAG